MGGPSGMLGADRSQLGDAKFDRQVVRRVLRFARPYRAMLLGFLGRHRRRRPAPARPAAAVPPDHRRGHPAGHHRGRPRAAPPAGRRGRRAPRSAARAWRSSSGGCRRASARASSSTCGSPLFDHVQRMPHRLLHPHPDRRAHQPDEQRRHRRPAGAHRHARLGRVERHRAGHDARRHGPASSGGSPCCRWSLLPLFILPAKRVGRRLQAITRERMDLNASMNTTMTERFNVSGALLVKLFGRARRRERRVRRPGRPGARHRRAQRACTAARSSSPSAWSAPSAPPSSTGSAASWSSRHDHARHAGRPGRLRHPASTGRSPASPTPASTCMTAFVSFDRVFEVLDTPTPIADRPGAVDLVDAAGPHRARRRAGSATRPASEVSLASLEGDGRRGRRRDERRRRPVLRGVTRDDRAGPARRARRAVGRGQDDARRCSSPASTTSPAAPCASTATTCATSPRTSLRAAIGVVSQDPHLFHDTVGDNLRYARPDATDAELEAAAGPRRSTT